MQELFESWRKFKKVINELTTDARYGNSYEELKKLIDEASHRTWIFFDTETTGLGDQKDYNQVTQVAAIAVDMKGFKPHEEPEILGKINVKINLARESRRFIKWQSDKVAAGENFHMTVPQVFKMTGYGVTKNPEKRRRKDFIKHGDGKKLEDFPVDKEKKFHRMDSAMTQFIEFLDKYDERVIVAQNAPFDVGYLNEMFRRIGKNPPDDMVVDTVQIFKKYLVPIIKEFKAKKESGEELTPEEHRMLNAMSKLNKAGKPMLSASLGNIIQAFDIKNEGWHDALADVLMLMKVLRAAIVFLDNRDMNGIQLDQTPNDPNGKPSDIPL